MHSSIAERIVSVAMLDVLEDNICHTSLEQIQTLFSKLGKIVLK